MIKKCISKGWKFCDIPKQKDYLDVDLPHDYSVLKERDPDGDYSNGYFRVSNGKYVKYLNFDPDKHYILDIDGAYALTEVSLNEDLLALHPHGYTPLLVDLTDSIIDGLNNKLVITTNPLKESTRWYTGCGIYRDVFLWEGGDVRIEPWDMFISTKSVENNVAAMSLKYVVSSDVDKDILIKFSIFDNENNLIVCETDNLSCKKGQKIDNEKVISISSPKIWDVDTPNLYNLKTEILDGDNLLDLSENTFGIKTFSIDVKNGLIFNGKPLKLRGGCIHHDHGGLGAKAFPVAEERKIKLLKDAGFNAVRISHNPPSSALLEACDRLGMIVMDEAFDIWNKRKFVIHDYHIFFKEWWQRDIEYMVKRDRNHISVLSYSIGNEIYEIDGTSKGAEWAEKMTKEVKKHDDTKIVTAAIQKISLAEYRAEAIDPADYVEYMAERTGHGDAKAIIDITKDIEKPLDMIGFNYYHKKYDIFHQECPNKVIWGSENWNIGENANFFDYWNNVLNGSYNIGDFTWTAIDNLGEVGHGLSYWERDSKHAWQSVKYPWRSCFQGDLDLCGYRRPQSYFREAVWFGDNDIRIFVTHPEHFGEQHYGTRWHWADVNETWTFEDKYVGRPVKIETYTRADYVLWFVNGKEIGKSIPEKAIASLETIYEKGELVAKAFKDGKEFSSCKLVTASNPSAINLVAEKKEVKADGRDLIYIDVSVVDKDGIWMADYDGELTCSVTKGELVAFFSGCPNNEDDYSKPLKCHAFKGRALAVIKANEPGDVKVNVYSDELASGFASVKAL